MRIDHCYLCSGPCYPGHGMMFVRNDSKVRTFPPSSPWHAGRCFELAALGSPRAAVAPTSPCSCRTPSAQVFRFCRPKCHKAFLKKRNPRKVRWTKAFRKAAGKEMKVDSTFEFEKRRNKPVRYDRELMGATIRAMKRIGEIQQAREDRFFANRIKGKKAVEKARRDVEIAQNIDLVRPAVVRKTEEANVAATVRAKEKNAGRMETE
jgi:large subunit ribosomal protein L24e